MARRIALVVIALVAVLLGVVAVPLGILTANQERHDFRDDAVVTSGTISGVAEEMLGDSAARAPLTKAIADLRRRGDLVAVYDRAGRLVAGATEVPGLSATLLARARAGQAVVVANADERLLVLRPVSSDGRPVRLGTVVLARSTEPIDHRVSVLRAWLVLVSVAGLLAAAFIATALARWVGRPLSALETAAQNLGGGDFEVRAPTSSGPDEVRRLAANFNWMAARLESLVSGHRAMMADVSHQLRTPLAALRLRLDVLAQDTPAPLAEELAGAQDEVARLSRMVDGLLAAARAENVTTAPVPVPVQAVLRDRAAAWRPAAEEKSVAISASAVEPLTARMGEGHLEQILDNLLANALEAVPAGGHIWLSAGGDGGRITVTVADDGPGMTKQQQRAAFRRYVSATPGGTGLGLAIVHRLVTSDGGAAELSDTPGGGLTVTINVPALPRDRAGRRNTGPFPAIRDQQRPSDL
jgi:signal transduction histidine kinase